MPPHPNPARRRFRRRTIRVLVDYPVDGAIRCEYATTLGAGGLFLECDEPLPLGSLLKLRFRLPHEEDLHEIEGRVSWFLAPGDPRRGSQPPGMGVEFTDALAASKLAHALERIPE